MFVVVLQIDLGPAQCKLAVQLTQTSFGVLQAGVGGAQLASTEHATQVLVMALHIGVGPEHCSLFVQTTQACDAVQAGVVAGQCWSVVQPTQARVVGSQAGAVAGQFASPRQVTQVLDISSQ